MIGAVQTRPVETLIVQLMLYGTLILIGVLAWQDETRHRRDRAELDRHGRIETRPTPPPPPIRFTRDDPSPKPRRKEPAT